MNKERLKELSKMLKALPPERLDMNCWTNACGSAACALGWAAQHPPFQEQGLRLETAFGCEVPCYGDSDTEYWAATAFFEISLDTARWLFSPVSYETEDSYRSIPTPKQVAQRVDQIIAGKLARIGIRNWPEDLS